MKKLLQSITIAAIMFTVVLGLVACNGNGDPKDDFKSGVEYTMKDATIDWGDSTATEEEKIHFEEGQDAMIGNIQMKFDDDKVYNRDKDENEWGQWDNGSPYTKNGIELSLRINDNDVAAEIDGKKITMCMPAGYYEGATVNYTFERS
ncbi:MAG: hypothetical protein LBH47_01490 [Christensenellaceae bacterium]|jgi:hypothetical protein|nr:hypothetical protein [Christensenellaceae bacterium]